jgi:hypothetical protein
MPLHITSHNRLVVKLDAKKNKPLNASSFLSSGERPAGGSIQNMCGKHSASSVLTAKVDNHQWFADMIIQFIAHSRSGGHVSRIYSSIFCAFLVARAKIISDKLSDATPLCALLFYYLDVLLRGCVEPFFNAKVNGDLSDLLERVPFLVQLTAFFNKPKIARANGWHLLQILHWIKNRPDIIKFIMKNGKLLDEVFSEQGNSVLSRLLKAIGNKVEFQTVRVVSMKSPVARKDRENIRKLQNISKYDTREEEGGADRKPTAALKKEVGVGGKADKRSGKADRRSTVNPLGEHTKDMTRFLDGGSQYPLVCRIARDFILPLFLEAAANFCVSESTAQVFTFYRPVGVENSLSSIHCVPNIFEKLKTVS